MIDANALNGAAPPEAVEGEAPLAPEATPPEETEDTRTARQRVLDFFEDTEGPEHTVAEIISGTGLERGLVEVTLSRGTASGVFERPSVGHYRLAPPKPKAPPPPPVSPPEAPPPESESVEQRTEREQAETAAAADYALMNALIQACGQNILGDSDEVGAIKMALEVVGLETVLRALGGFAPRPGQVPPRAITSFREKRVLEAIAFEAMVGMIETVVKKWLSAPIVRIAPAEEARASEHAAAVSPDRFAVPSIHAEPGSVAYVLAKVFGHDGKPIRPPAAPKPPEPEDDEFDEAGWEELVIGWRLGHLQWNVDRFGPEPGNRGCRVPARLLRANGF